MDRYCKNCRNVRTASDLGVVSPVTKADELFCGKHPPQTGEQSVRRPDEPTRFGSITSPQYDTYIDQPIRLPPCNDGRGYRGMACWDPVEDAPSAEPPRARKILVHGGTLQRLDELIQSEYTTPAEWAAFRAELVVERCGNCAHWLSRATLGWTLTGLAECCIHENDMYDDEYCSRFEPREKK